MRILYQACVSFLVLTLLSGLSCKERKNAGQDKADPVFIEYASISHANDSCWNTMIKSDDAKISNMKRLVEELTLIEGYKEEAMSALKRRIDSLPGARYDRISMQVSSRIDSYDSVTNIVLSELKKKTAENPNTIKYQIVSQLIDEIQIADDSVLLYRKEYDRTIDRYRVFANKKGKEFRKKYAESDSLQHYSLFRLMP